MFFSDSSSIHDGVSDKDLLTIYNQLTVPASKIGSLVPYCVTDLYHLDPLYFRVLCGKTLEHMFYWSQNDFENTLLGSVFEKELVVVPSKDDTKHLAYVVLPLDFQYPDVYMSCLRRVDDIHSIELTEGDSIRIYSKRHSKPEIFSGFCDCAKRSKSTCDEDFVWRMCFTRHESECKQIYLLLRNGGITPLLQSTCDFTWESRRGCFDNNSILIDILNDEEEYVKSHEHNALFKRL